MLAGLGAIESVDYNYRLIRGIVASAEEGLGAVHIDDHASFVFPVVVGCREETKRQEAIRDIYLSDFVVIVQQFVNYG